MAAGCWSITTRPAAAIAWRSPFPATKAARGSGPGPWDGARPPATPAPCHPGGRWRPVPKPLGDGLQLDGGRETARHRRFPKRELIVRNLGFSGDELTLRLRSANFGSPDEWLTRCRADVVFAF